MSVCIVQDEQLKDITYIHVNIFHILPSYSLGTKPLSYGANSALSKGV